MSVTTVSAHPARRRDRSASRERDALKPARGIMVGLGLSALIWTGIGALLFG